MGEYFTTFTVRQDTVPMQHIKKYDKKKNQPSKLKSKYLS